MTIAPETKLYDSPKKRWPVFYTICLAALMTVLDGTVIDIALPSIKSDLSFSDASLAWVIDSYLLTFAGFLLLGGRLGDRLGYRRLYVAGVALFTLASLGCGVSTSPGFFIGARALQGIGAAFASALSISLITTLFPSVSDRVRALSFFGGVNVAGTSLGLFLGGIITSLWSWHWLFLVNVPIGATVCGLSAMLLPKERKAKERTRVDLAGGLTITTSLIFATFASIQGAVQLFSGETLGSMAAACLFLVLFVYIESRAAVPMIPPDLFRSRSVVAANIVGVLLTTATITWYYVSALYLQRILTYTPLQAGMTFLPANLAAAAAGLAISTNRISRFGPLLPMVVGALACAGGLSILARAPLDGDFFLDVLPGMLLLGLGSGMTSTPLLIAATTHVKRKDLGVASGAIGTSCMLGGALGLAIVISVAASHSSQLLAGGFPSPTALNGGYHLAFLIGALASSAAALICALFLGASGRAFDTPEAEIK